MREYIDVTGKNEEEAISKALAQLGLDRDDVSVEILERAKSGFLGLGSCPAKVRVSYGPEEEEPAPVESALSSIGSINTPMAMMIIGASLAHSDIRAAFSKPRLYRVALLRLIIMPLVFIGLSMIVPISRMLAGICVIVAAMPIAGNCSMLSDIYTPEDMTSSHAVIVTTLFSGVTLPLLVMVMSLVGLG